MELQPGPQGIAAAGPVGVDHSMGSNQVPMDHNCQPARRGLQLLAHGSIQGIASSPGPQLQTGSELITRWNFNPARRGLQLLARSALITQWDSN
jgi:hypothetical protein